MTNLIIASFKEEAEAIAASKKLNDLETIGDITIFEMVVVKKNPDGEAVVLQEPEDSAEGVKTISGMAVGTLVGSLAGPVGMVLGMFTGTMVGAADEADDYGFAADFVSGVEEHLQPGTAAVVAEVEEDDPVFIDSTLNMIGATVTRTDVNYEYTKYSDEEIDEFDEDIAAAREKLKGAAAEDKDRIRQRIAKLKDKRKDRISELKEKAQDKISELKEKAKEAVAEVKVSAKERKVARLRDKIEKHQEKISSLEKKLQAALGKGKEEEVAKEGVKEA
jgi:uncharacterized membrane protein